MDYSGGGGAKGMLAPSQIIGGVWALPTPMPKSCLASGFVPYYKDNYHE